MKVTHYFNYFFLLAGIILLNACQEDEIKEPNGVKISFQAVTDLRSSSDTLILEEAFIGVQAIDLKRDGEADSATVEKIVYNGPYVVDLLSGTVSPAIRWIFAEPGYYREIKVTTYSALPRGKSIVLRGIMFSAEREEEIPFELISSRSHTLSVKNNAGITIREGEDLDLLVVFDLSDLFRRIDLNEFEKNEQGVVVISEDEGTGAVASLINAFDAFSRFGIDNGLPFQEWENEYLDDESSDEDQIPDDNNTNENEDSENGSDDAQDENSSGDEPGDSDNNDDGSTGDDDSDGSTDENDDGGSGNESDDNSDNDNSDGSSDDNDGSSGNDDEDESGDENDDAEDDDESEDDEDEEDSDDGTEDEEDEDENKDKNKDKGNNGKGNKNK